ncbi:MAG: 16S rRNA (uracil(1498)-N(3))-methyltransferase [Candidatus Competibacteraceae bacterium]|nr:16S rRNA (uracil(1498)-N(3))-methyltransferase [Candidatus Competibacteraceae bacterium]
MRIPRLHLPGPLSAAAERDLEGPALHYLTRVLRLKPGAPLVVFDGRGGEYRAVLTRVERRRARLRLEDFDPREVESPLAVTLAQAVSRGERMDYTLQKAVELGVTAIQPLLTGRSVVNLAGERQARRLEHWQGVVVGACEQSGRNRIPELLAPRELEPWLGNFQGRGLLLDPEAVGSLAQWPFSQEPLTLLIGPEGGFNPRELAAARGAGFQGVRLGPRVMRTETAGVAALAVLQALWGDLR